MPLTEEQEEAFVGAWPPMQIFPDVAEALGTLASFGWRLAILTNCDDDLFAATSARLPVPFEVVVTAEQVRSYKPDLGHFRKFTEITGATPANWIHVANSWVHDIRRPPGWGSARSGSTVTTRDIPLSSRSGGSPRCAAWRRR